MLKWRNAAMVAGLVTLTACATAIRADGPDSPPTVRAILDGKSVWRVFTELKPPVIQYEDGAKPLTSTYEWVDKETPAAAEGWNKQAFDDGSWLKTDARGEPQTPYAARLLFRSHFEVTDPAAVKDLKLSLTFHGGVIVYLNGSEVGRANIAADGKGLAEAYPQAAFVNEKGQLTGGKEAQAARDRTTAISIPSDKLQKGANLIAIEVVRAPYDKVIADYWKRQPKDTRELGEKNLPYDLNWYTCELVDARLLTASTAVVPNNVRPKQLQAWNSNLLAYDTAADFGDRCDPLRPVVIKGSKNGWYSGKVVLGLPKAIEGLKVTCGELKQGSASIPASAVKVRYGVSYAERDRSDAPLESLLEEPLASFPPGPNGTVVPVWFTVKIPKDAKAGTYTGEATINVQGEKSVTVPLNVEVADFTLPDTQDYTTWIELMQSPDTLAREYNVPLWSDKHWELIAQSMKYIGEIGSRTLHVPLIAQTNSGNAESMVRWIKKPDGTFDYDFTNMDRYLDCAEKNMGRPKFVAFIAWEIYLDTPKDEVKMTEADQADSYRAMEKSWAAARWDMRGKGPAVTAYDPETKQTALVNLPRFEDPAAAGIWKPLFDELHKRMAKRGLENTMLLGMASDKYPNKDEMKVLWDVSGHLPWINHGHGGNMVGTKLDGIAPMAYNAYVWNSEYPHDPSKGRTYGWKRPELWVEFRRGGALNGWPLASIMLFPEIEITGGQRGLGRIGGDFWPVFKDKRGERRGWVWNNYPQSMWHSCQLQSHLLNPGPSGAVATARYEAMREGMENCEARIAIERVLTDAAKKGTVSADLADKAQQVLDDRIWQELKGFSGLQLTGRMYTTYQRYYNVFYYNAGGTAGGTWYTGSDWQDRAQELYTLAGKVSQPAAK